MLDMFAGKDRARAIGVACFMALASTAVAGAHEPVLPQDGTYLSSAYLAALEKTKSHFAAVYASAAPQAVNVLRDTEGGVELDSVVGFYEQATAVYDPKKPTVFEDPDSGAKKPFTWIDATHFKIGRGKGQSTYRAIGDLQEFLIGKLLAGTYADARGQKYVFGADGKAQFPDRTFRFEILTNVLDEECDQIIERAGEKGGKEIGFAWRGKSLFLYNMDCSENSAGCTPDRKHPIAVLHKAG